MKKEIEGQIEFNNNIKENNNKYFDTDIINDKLSEEADKFLTEFNKVFNDPKKGKQYLFRVNTYVNNTRNNYIKMPLEEMKKIEKSLDDSLSLINNNPLYKILNERTDKNIIDLDSYKNAKKFFDDMKEEIELQLFLNRLSYPINKGFIEENGLVKERYTEYTSNPRSLILIDRYNVDEYYLTIPTQEKGIFLSLIPLF